MRLEKLSRREFMAVYGKCRDCGAPVSYYTCNGEIVIKRPEAANEDWWAACDNEECGHHYGEGVFQDDPDWLIPATPDDLRLDTADHLGNTPREQLGSELEVAIDGEVLTGRIVDGRVDIRGIMLVTIELPDGRVFENMPLHVRKFKMKF